MIPFFTTVRLGVVVLAAGEGTRMRSALPKVLHPLCGRPLIGHILAAVDALQPAIGTIVLASDALDTVRARFGDTYRYVVQSERLGTGHATLQARSIMVNQCDDALVLVGDAPLIRSATLQRLVALRREQNALVALLSFTADPPTGYGRVIRDAEGNVTAIVEERDATDTQRAVTEVNSGILCFDAAWMWPALDRIQRSPVKGEYYLTDLVALAIADHGIGAVQALRADDPSETLGVNDRVQLAQAEHVLRLRLLDALMRSGVTVVDPAATYVDVDVVVGQDTTLLPGTMLRGATRVGARCTIGPHTSLIDTIVADDAHVRYTLAEGVVIPAHAVIGPFAHLRGAQHAVDEVYQA
ncbi:bifunctional UDP-N-acetylglucosamine diphosphorylase/glucosamine-1-phosphate N-acetyltransferase GlmU [Roseiflexus castenholzii]|jgi:bifunctional UDP-N-acetylglucosamine pyrophosphorylase/glucosamine-1-phosphate N-acetyltransferase|uniref:Nucleotidyl transferase n=1 Tax=Roseiflexus castenholzii (strain DSM 13941 / HLO8) TaxID=383372 RepID=A7NHB0_ROSCS|nr:NTP transferase domain-containing protein [Roseiflexus castenholzii]ABU56857.1 Nucleotidyl transferase [Roseiflexus castenholzii DSM 13941]